MKNKTTRILGISLGVVIVICMVVFSVQTVRMNRRSAKMMTDIGETYMSGLSEQVTLHFGTIIEMKLSQVVAFAHDVMTSRVDGDGEEEIREMLTEQAGHRGVDQVAFYMGSQRVDMVCGRQIVLSDSLIFVESIEREERRIGLGRDAEGKPVILFGTPLHYRLKNGEQSISLVVGLSVDDLEDMLLQGMDKSMTYYVIRKDGTMIIQKGEEEDATYYDKIMRNLQEMGAGEAERKEMEEYLDGLNEAMVKGKEYTKDVPIDIERRRAYCKSLPHSEWYLILSMPYGMLDESIENFGKQWSNTAFINGLIIIALFLAVFAVYFLLTRQQMKTISEAKNAAETASRAKSEFLSNMSHDIRTPMNGIIGMTEIANADIDNDEKVKKCLRKISLSSKHLLGLINDVMDMAKIESGKMILNMEQISLPELIHDSVNIVQPQMRERKQRFDLHIHDILAENVWGDSVRLNQILLNLLGNAIKFTPEGGNIQMELCQEASEKGEKYARVYLRVRDNGIGMTPEFQKKIFDSFAREDNARVQKIEGAGLGMSITKYIVDAMGGTILVESEKGKGSEFEVILDMEMAPAAVEKVDVPAWKTLVVDDDEVFCACTLDTLETIGIKAQSALDGKMALEMLEEEHRKGEDYEIVLVDWRLPEMDGIELTRFIREKYGNRIHILMISASDNSDVEEVAKEAGVDNFIVKPLFRSTLYYNLSKIAEIPEKEELEKTTKDIAFSGEHILLAEDIDLNWEVASALLSGVGLELEHAENGKICVDMLSQSSMGYYKAVLMDIRMPVMTGYEAAKAIRALDREDARNIPIIAMSADAFHDDVKKCKECGMNAHIAKPIDLDKLVRTLKKYMKK